MNTAQKNKIRKMITDRKNGMYQTQETFDEAELSFSQMTSTDVAITLLISDGVFNVLDKKELLYQMRIWKNLRCVSHYYNVKEIQICGKKAYMFVIQPQDLEKTTMCPLAVAFNTLVNGYTYITPHKEIVELVCHYLMTTATKH